MPRLAVLFTALLLSASPAGAQPLRTLEWRELVPAGYSPPEPAPVLHDLTQLADALAAETGPAAAQQAPAAPVVAALDGLTIKLPGYIVPLDVTEEGRVVEFLLVPYFGACIHVPPPPSNQIVHVTSELGVLLDALYQPFWIEGPLQVQARSSELAETGYALVAEKIYPYELPTP